MKQPLLRKCAVCVLVLATLMTGSVLRAQEKEHPIPRLVTKDGRHALLVDGEPYLILGGQSDNSSTWPKMLPGVWQVIEEMNANTLEIPVYWEQIEPEEGTYDFSMVDLLLEQAREREVRLVLLWFATWKNGSNHYMPVWMKRQPKKYPNVVGKDGKPVDSPSPHALATREADAKAFAALMRHLKEADPQHTVIMVQVENEPGTWGSVRDYSEEAERLFRQPVPEALLKPEVLKALGVDAHSKGTWSEVFGERADEYFHAWSVASYIEYVAAAGRAVYPLPMYVNVALRWPFGNPPATNYESGGPTDNVIPIWKAAAPSLCLLAPDIYLQGDEPVLKVIELYARFWAKASAILPSASTIPRRWPCASTMPSRRNTGFWRRWLGNWPAGVSRGASSPPSSWRKRASGASTWGAGKPCSSSAPGGTRASSRTPCSVRPTAKPCW